MLWIAGLMGIAGVGAASLSFPTSVEEDPEDDFLDDEFEDEGTDNLFDQLPNLNAAAFDGIPTSDATTVFSDTLGEAQQETSSDPLFDDETETPEWADDLDGGVGYDLLAGISPDASMPSSESLSDYDEAAETEEADGYGTLLTSAESPSLIGDWITQGIGVEVIDFTAEQESLMLVWDDTSDGAMEPDVSVSPDPDDPEVMRVLMNGVDVAEIYGDPELSAADLTVIPLSSALIIGLQPAA